MSTGSSSAVSLRQHGASAQAQAAALAVAAWRYWTSVFPLVCGELRGWRRRAQTIPDAELRSDALRALCKRSNLEGAAAFATFVPTHRRAAVVRVSVAFQAAYDYLDVLAEQPNRDAVQNSFTLNEALVAALSPDAPRRDFYARHRKDNDGGYLVAMLDRCQAELSTLPHWPTAQAGALRATKRAARFQGFNCGRAQGDLVGLAEWSRRLVAPDSSLTWWESAAAAGSSLGVHALIAAAACGGLDVAHAAAIEDAYFPWIGALHSLLDQLVDAEQDAATSQANIAACYRNAVEAAEGIGRLARRASDAVATFESHGAGLRHRLLLCAMVASYLEQSQARAADAAVVREAVLAELGPLARASIVVFRARRAFDRV